jgi:hypothetical protein
VKHQKAALKARFTFGRAEVDESRFQRCWLFHFTNPGALPQAGDERAPLTLNTSRRSVASLRSAFLLPKGVNNKEHYRDRDARVGYIKGRPRIGVSNVQIEKEKIDHVPIKEAIS